MLPTTHRPERPLSFTEMTALSHRESLEAALAALPETLVGEIIFDELVTQPRPAFGHASATSALVEALTPPFRRGVNGPGGWIILFEPEVRFGPHVLVPDLAGWRRTTMPELPLVARTDVAPDWVCEVLSPGTEARDRNEKKLIYAANAVAFMWLVDVENHAIEASTNERGTWREVGVFRGDEDARVAPFDAVPLPMAWLWAR
jgi:Uma2 family endonuclease